MGAGAAGPRPLERHGRVAEGSPGRAAAPPEGHRIDRRAARSCAKSEGVDGGLVARNQPAEAAALVHGDFVAAMGDASNFGLAKSLIGAAVADGVDLTDQDQFEEVIAAANAGPEEHRRRVIPDSALSPARRSASPHRPVLPPVALLADDEAAASRSAAPIVALFSALAAYVGDGRKLTQTGNLTLADARALVELLGTVPPRRSSTRSGSHPSTTTWPAEAVLDAFRFPSLDDDVARRVGNDVVDIVDALELAGVVRRTGWTDHREVATERSLRRSGGSVELTAAGVGDDPPPADGGRLRHTGRGALRRRLRGGAVPGHGRRRVRGGARRDPSLAPPARPRADGRRAGGCRP